VGTDVRKIAGYLDAIKWHHEVLDGRILTTFLCDVPFYSLPLRIEIRVGQHWVSVRAFMLAIVPAETRVPVMLMLSEINARLHQVRAFLVDDCAILQVDVPANQCSQQEFLQALEVVYKHASEVGLELAVLATDPLIAELYASVETRRLAELAQQPVTPVDGAALDFELNANRLPD
jgi:hypothetical protein